VEIFIGGRSLCFKGEIGSECGETQSSVALQIITIFFTTKYVYFKDAVIVLQLPLWGMTNGE
jgi:hypothetical protein